MGGGHRRRRQRPRASGAGHKHEDDDDEDDDEEEEDGMFVWGFWEREGAEGVTFPRPFPQTQRELSFPV